MAARKPSPQKPSPSGGRWHGEAVTDEGAGFGLRSLYAGDFAAISALRAAALRRLRSETRLRAQCGASSFSPWKRNQKTLGDTAEANFVRQ